MCVRPETHTRGGGVRDGGGLAGSNNNPTTPSNPLGKDLFCGCLDFVSNVLLAHKSSWTFHHILRQTFKYTQEVLIAFMLTLTMQQHK